MSVKHIAAKNSVSRLVRKPVAKSRVSHKNDINKIAGCLSSADAAELKAIIEQGCEQVDHDAWKNLH
jgi:hypothetical protein